MYRVILFIMSLV